MLTAVRTFKCFRAALPDLLLRPQPFRGQRDPWQLSSRVAHGTSQLASKPETQSEGDLPMQLAKLSLDADAWLNCFGCATSEPMSAHVNRIKPALAGSPRNYHKKFGFPGGKKTPGPCLGPGLLLAWPQEAHTSHPASGSQILPASTSGERSQAEPARPNALAASKASPTGPRIRTLNPQICSPIPPPQPGGGDKTLSIMSKRPDWGAEDSGPSHLTLRKEQKALFS